MTALKEKRQLFKHRVNMEICINGFYHNSIIPFLEAIITEKYHFVNEARSSRSGLSKTIKNHAT
jgi:hypothetical protein